ncbi:UNVERIFIED_CONTAM: hypothetical protein GTU68_000135 [Idotea baltica]|nr:hypothetical protein [Idotea baltica]
MKQKAETALPTKWGEFKMLAYENKPEEMPHLALVSGEIDGDQPVIVRIHSECMTGDLFGSVRCDCGEQLDAALQMTSEKGGVVVYLRQEGRGIGLINKMHAYNLQDAGMNTADANTELGFEVDERNFEIAIEILESLGIKEIRLMTNNPEKVSAFEGGPIRIVERIPIAIPPKKENQFYLSTKQLVMGHYLDVSTNGTH